MQVGDKLLLHAQAQYLHQAIVSAQSGREAQQ